MKDFASHDGLSLAALVRSGQVTARDLVSASIERIEAAYLLRDFDDVVIGNQELV